jgi:acetyl esterase
MVATQEKLVRLMRLAPVLEKQTPETSRDTYRLISDAFARKKNDITSIENRVIESDDVPLSIRIYRTELALQKDKNSCLVYFHGGGGVIGDLESHDDFCQYIASSTDIVVISIDYRLAPEFPFPVPVEDAIRSWNWVCEHSAELNVDLLRSGVGGDSAGAYLATSICQQKLNPALSVQPVKMPAFQWLVYPMLDARQVTPSAKSCVKDMLLTRATVTYFYDHLFPASVDRNGVLASPCLNEELSGLPPTYISTAGFDPLEDEGHQYILSLKQQGVVIINDHFPNVMHGFIGFLGVCPTSRKYAQVMLDKLQALIEGLPAAK